MSISYISNGIDIAFFFVWSQRARDAGDAIDKPLNHIAIRSLHRNASTPWHKRIFLFTSIQVLSRTHISTSQDTGNT